MIQNHINIVKTSCFLFSILFLCVFVSSRLQAGEIDKTRYITIDEIKPGMDATCLTVYKGVEIERFNLKVVDVVRGFEPSRNAILVMGTDERFIHTGPVAGCSGSPVYINNRLAGALAFAWTYSKDPLYGVTPIEEMLRAGTYAPTEKTSLAPTLDFSKPVDLKTAYNQTINFKSSESKNTGISRLLCPITTNLPQESFADSAGAFESAGLLPVSGGASGELSEYNDVQMKPGGILALPLVYGDIDMAAIGTITEVADGKVYAFGHNFTGEGPIDVPMATGYVHTVVAGIVRSFKFGQAIDIKGALYADESTAVVGEIGRKAATIPMRLTIERFNDKKIRTYNCQVVSHRLYTPLLVKVCMEGTAEMLGAVPAESSIQYKTRIGIEGHEPVCLKNFSSDSKLEDYLFDSIGALTLVMNNPYEKAAITSLDFEVNIMPQTAISHIWSFDISNTTVKPGQTITANITLESYRAGLKNYKQTITIPENIPPGNYKLLLGGTQDYMQFLTKMAPYRYTPENLPGLISIINDIANTKRTNLHLILILPPGGIAIETAQLPQLPLSKSLLLNDEKRSIPAKPVAQWLEETIPVDTIVIDSRTIDIVVEK